MSIELADLIGEKLDFKSIQPFGGTSRGCISSGRYFQTERGPIFVKTNSKNEAKEMFLGEMASLRAIQKINSIKCPKPFGAFEIGYGEWAMVMEYIEMNGKKDERELARQLAKMHLSNEEKLASKAKRESFVGSEECLPTERFGFPIPTSCGLIAQENSWNERWDEFFIRNRLEFHVNRLEDRNLNDLWPQLVRAAESLLKETSSTIPSLVHGDLWSGNWSFSKDGPVIYDPACFYGDLEYEQGIMNMFGGVTSVFWEEYHKLIPERKGRKHRVLLYKLFHHLNHWSHFGSGYKGSSLGLIREILSLQPSK